MFMNTRKPRVSEEGFPPGAKLLWSDKENRLVLQVPKNPIQPPSQPQPSASAAMIDRVLGVPARP